MKNKQSLNWFLDAGLLVGFLAAFFLDWTGVDLHQWLGIGLGMVAGYHLLAHWSWVKSVTARLISQAGTLSRSSAQTRARQYYWIDASLLVGFGFILFTGLVISTWLNLDLAQYAVWVDVHVFSSIATLAVLVLKIGLHWRWVIVTAQRMFVKPSRPVRQHQPVIGSFVRAPVEAVAPKSAPLTRRHFIGLMGMVGMSAWAAINNVFSGQESARAEALPGGNSAPTTPLGAAAAVVGPSTAVETVPSVQAAPVPTATTTTKQGTVLATPTASASAGSVTGGSCRVQCSKRCSYPGKCRKYVDRNNNKKCDLGECL
jgi:hypothetical protein